MMEVCTYPTQFHKAGIPYLDIHTASLYGNQEMTNVDMAEFEDADTWMRTEVFEPNNCNGELRNSYETQDYNSPYEELFRLCAQFQSASIGEENTAGDISVAAPRNSDTSIDGPTDNFVTDAKTIYKQDPEGDTLLHIAIIVQNVSEVMQFINLAPAPCFLSIQNSLFQSPLHLAVLTNQDSIVRRLVVGGANLESRDKDGNSPLHTACREGYLNVVKALLTPVSDFEKMQNSYHTGTLNVDQVMEIPNYEGLPCLHLAAMAGHFNIVRHLIERGANINSIDRKSGRTLLHKTAAAGNLDFVKLLLSFPTCDINARAFDDSTPFDLARDRRYHAITYELAAEGTRRMTSDESCNQ